MRRRAGPLRRIVAAVLGLAVMLPATARPAVADPPPDGGYSQYVNAAVELLKSLMQKLLDGRLSAAEAVDLVFEAINALNGVKVDLVERLDAAAVADLRAKVDTAATSVHYLRTPPTAAIYLGLVNEAAHVAKAQIDVVTSDAAKEAVGRAVVTLYVSLMVAEARTGMFNPVTRYPDYRQALERVRLRLEPACVSDRFPEIGPPTYSCTFNGRRVQAVQGTGADGTPEVRIEGVAPIPGQINLAVMAAVQDIVMDGTADALAEQALVELARRDH